jgi:hypothetical protein
MKCGIYIKLHVGSGLREAFSLSVGDVFRNLLSANESSHVTNRESLMQSSTVNGKSDVYLQYSTGLLHVEYMYRYMYTEERLRHQRLTIGGGAEAPRMTHNKHRSYYFLLDIHVNIPI